MRELKIEEKYSAQWPIITVLSMVLAIAIFSSLLFIESTLLAGYARLTAFAFFALGVIGLFKLREGKVLLIFSMEDDRYMNVDYIVKNEVKHTESWDIKPISTIKIDEMPNRSFYNDIVTSDRCIAIRNENESDWTYLHKMHGRVIPLKSESARKIKKFIEEEIENLSAGKKNSAAS